MMVGGRRYRSTWSRRSSMFAAGIVLSIVGLGFFCWLLFTLAI